MASWLGPEGELVVVLQSADNDCMDLLDRFFGRRFDLAAAGVAFEKEQS